MTTIQETVRVREAPIADLAGKLTAASGFSDATLRSDAPDAISLLSGIPDASALPIDAFGRALERLRADHPRAVGAFQYSASQGLAPLREWIARREGVAPERIVITTGGAQGISLAVQALIPDDALVAVDNPVWPLFLRYLELKTTNTLPIPVGPDGIDVDELERQLQAGKPIRALYTVPDFHNPTQSSLSAEKRARITELADEFGFWFLADNPYRELYFGDAPGDVSALNRDGNTVHINTFSKTLGPGLRLGWIVAPTHAVEALVRLRNRIDSQTSTFTQTLVQELLLGEPDFFDSNLVTARQLYKSRAEAFVAALERHAPRAFEATAPGGGYFLWARFADPSVDWKKFHRAAVANGVNYQAGAFFVSGPGSDADRYLRFAYGDNSVERLDEAARRLGEAYASVRRDGGAA